MNTNKDAEKDIDKCADSGVLLVVVTCPAEEAGAIARALLEPGLAACINIIPQVTSIYRWQGELQQDIESLMLIKCPAFNYPTLEERILKLHPYELPEIITVSVSGGLTGYLDWVLRPENNQSE